MSLSADDGVGSGVTSVSYAVDGGAPQTYASPFTVSGVGQHAVTYWATDAAGNVEAVQTGWVNISNPFAQATNLSADNHSGWRNAATTVTITGSGDRAPIVISYGVDGGGVQQAATNPATVTAERRRQPHASSSSPRTTPGSRAATRPATSTSTSRRR